MALRNTTTPASRAGLFCLSAFVIAGALLGDLSQAAAETLSISATGLVRRCPCGATTEDLAEEQKGVFVAKVPDGTYFVPVVFPVTTGQRVCSLTMVYEDINAADTIIVRLYRKAYVAGGNPFNNPAVMATVKSAAGVPATVRIATTSTITAPVISPNVFYYIEADVTTVNLNLLGFKIEYKPSC